MLPEPSLPRVVTHWGSYELNEQGEVVPVREDLSPSPIGIGMEQTARSPARVREPMVRASFLAHRSAAGGEGRGREPFVPVSWQTAEELVAEEIERIRSRHGNAAIYGGSYGWGSAGRFHHAQSQIHRFLNLIGGCTRSVQNYSYAAGDVILPYVVGSAAGLSHGHTNWSEIRAHARQVVMFGGMPSRNGQVNAGGMHVHQFASEFEACRRDGLRMVLVSPIGDDSPACDDWLCVRPNSDVALMLALAYVVLEAGREDIEFLARCTVGAQAAIDYILGRGDGVAKTPAWAAPIVGLCEERIRGLALSLLDQKTFISMSWSLQRARHGEQPYWMLITLCSLLGTIGRPGLGFGFGYGSIDGIGLPENGFSWPSLPQGVNPIDSYIPVARIADMLLSPHEAYNYRGMRRTYPDIRMVYWAGGNPFHHHQDINRLIGAWRRPEVIVVHEPWWTATARFSDIVLPATLPVERNDIACSPRDRAIMPSHRIVSPIGEARDDYDIFAAIAARLGVAEAFTEGRDAEGWLRWLYDALPPPDEPIPDFDDFWQGPPLTIRASREPSTLLADFRNDPDGHPLRTPSGRIELYSETIAAYGYADCPPHASWLEPEEWYGGSISALYALHLISSQPATRLHSQLDPGPASRGGKVAGREPLRMHPDDAAARGLAAGSVVRIYNDRGACLAGLVLSDRLRPGVVQLSTGAWYDPVEPGQIGSLDAHGNPNVLTRDIGASALSQGPSAHSCMVEVEAFDGTAPIVRAFTPPATAPFDADIS